MIKPKPKTTNKRSNITNTYATQSQGKSINLGSIAKRKRPISLAKVNLKDITP